MGIPSNKKIIHNAQDNQRHAAACRPSSSVSNALVRTQNQPFHHVDPIPSSSLGQDQSLQQAGQQLMQASHQTQQPTQVTATSVAVGTSSFVSTEQSQAPHQQVQHIDQKLSNTSLQHALLQLIQGISNTLVTGIQLPNQLIPQSQPPKGHSIAAVSEPPILEPVAILPSTPSIGLEETFKEVWGFLRDDKVGKIGIYGMGGVGKTTLLETINNKLEGTHDFDVVIWVIVSKEIKIDQIQERILERLNLPYRGERMKDKEVIFRALCKRNFVLLFDDLWERIDLGVLGVPDPAHSDKKMSKVLFTTRTEDVCGQMRAHRKIKVNCLAQEQAWDLFRENVGEEALGSHSEIPNLAQEVAYECRGLPLALTVIARAMTCKTTPQEWKHALTTLRNAPHEISGTEKDLYYRLKFSYDMLPNDSVRKCFLYCSLFPEGHLFHVKEMIKYWMVEGFLDGYENADEAINKGYDVIGTLKVSCLLEPQIILHRFYVKMHDVIRDMALWIASDCGVNQAKFFVKAGIGLRIPKADNWKELEIISLMSNKITKLSGAPCCHKLRTLLLQRNRLKQISETFFQFMPVLRVLDLSYTGLMMLPSSIGQLVELQYLNLSGTCLTMVPKEIRNLENLRRLDMIDIPKMPTFHLEVISWLSKLQVDIQINERAVIRMGYYKHGKLKVSESSDISNLEKLEFSNLSNISVFIRKVSTFEHLSSSKKLAQCITELYMNLDMNYLKLLPSFGTRLRKLHIGSCPCTEDIEIWGERDLDGKYQTLPTVKVLEIYKNPYLKRIRVSNSLGQCLQRLAKLIIQHCKLLEDISFVKYLPSLEYLTVRSNDVMEELCHQLEVEEGLIVFPKLKHLHISTLRVLKRICEDVVVFPSLESLEVYGCPNLKKLPLGLLNEKRTLRTIKGNKKWWNNLEWGDHNIKAQFHPYFTKP